MSSATVNYIEINLSFDRLVDSVTFNTFVFKKKSFHININLKGIKAALVVI